jgi:hypothetical protein
MNAGAPQGRGDAPRHVEVDGRRWRATDPAIPDALRRELVAELTAARRAVKDAVDDEAAMAAARRRVGDAKVALGERGPRWWEPLSAGDLRDRSGAAARSLLRHRAPAATICPSEVARVAAGPGWRAAMDDVRAAAAELAAAGELVVSQKGRVRRDLSTVTGPVRYGRGAAFPDPPR